MTPWDEEDAIVVGIDASRNRSGGAIRHLVGILAHDPRAHGVREVHVWSYDALLDALPDAEWLKKHSPEALRGSIFRQAWWQRRYLPVEARTNGVDILLNSDAGTVCRAHPSVVMSRDMLSYEPGELRRYWFSRLWVRILALRYVQAWSMRDGDGVIFLTRYAAEVIQRFTGPLARVAIVPHGVGDVFRHSHRTARAPGAPLRCLYVSTTDLYKHQWWVVRAIADLRQRGHQIELVLTGGGDPRAERRLAAELERSDPRSEFVRQIGFVRPSDLPAVLGEADLFVFASSCENMPNTLVEAMASGLPIACSDRGPMPEVLRDGGVYFDPENPASIADAIERLMVQPDLRASLGRRAAELAAEFSWERCAAQTWTFLRDTFDSACAQRRIASLETSSLRPA